MSQRYRAVAAYYDAEIERQADLAQDVPFFLAQLPRSRLKILELGAGTGRAAIPLAQAGHGVVGVDYAPEMLQVARRKRDAVGLKDRELSLIQNDALALNLPTRFDWACLFFNTFLAFTKPTEQDQLLQVILRHLKPRGRLWLDLENPDHELLAREVVTGLDPFIFFVPELGRTVFRTTDLRRVTGAEQLRRVTFNYRWFDDHGGEHRKRTQFDMTYLFPRELRLLLERNGLRVERFFGGYDGSDLASESPRMIARCCRK